MQPLISLVQTVFAETTLQVDGPFVAAAGVILFGVLALVRQFFADRKKTRLAIEAAEEVKAVALETKTQLTDAAGSVNQGVLFLNAILDEHRHEVVKRLDTDRALWVDSLSGINGQMTSLHGKVEALRMNHDALLQLLADVEAKLPNRANRRRNDFSPNSTTTMTVRK